MAILNLQENGRIQMLYNKWWKNTGTCNNEDKKQESKASSLGLANVGGIFVVLCAGLVLAVITAVIEFMWNSKRNAKTERVRTLIMENYIPLCTGCALTQINLAALSLSLWLEIECTVHLFN